MEKIPTYRPGDTIRIELDLRDESGVGSVSARFDAVESSGGSSGTYLYLYGDGAGQREATVTISAVVPEKIVSSEYRCVHTEVGDTRGNYSHPHRDIRFRIEAPPTDLEGPDLTDWRFSD